MGTLALALEWPLPLLAGSVVHCSFELRLLLLPLWILAAVVMYQTTNAAVYYLLALAVYACAFWDGEVSFYTYMPTIHTPPVLA